MKPRFWVAFAALCLMSGSQWLFDQAWPGMLGGTQRTAVQDGLLAAVFGALSLRRGCSVATTPWMKLALWAGAMFGLPEVVLAALGGHVPDTVVVLALMLVPVVVVMVIAQKSAGFGLDEGPLRRMMPALVAIGGATLLIPMDLPASVVGRVWLVTLAAAVILAAVAAVRMNALLTGVGVLPASALVALTSGVIAAAFWNLGGTGTGTGTGTWSWSGAEVEALRLLLEGTILLLTVWLLREMKPIAFSARFLLVPLVTIAESIVVMRPETSWTTWAGLLLLAGGGIWLVRSGSE